MAIRLLPQNIVNRIAAGEVLERPSSAVKELVENAIDAGASDIKIKLEAGGKNLVSVQDNGSGMTPEELQLAVQRHATSKIPDDDLFNIKFMGFRGEALPSIGSVAKLSITSRKNNSAFAIDVIGGDVLGTRPANHAAQGTIVEVRDLFFVTPARLKFMKSDDSERNACVDIIKKIAMAHPDISFELEVDGKPKFKFQKSNLQQRIADIIGAEFADNSVEINAEREGVRISGFAGIPTFNRRTSEDQYLYMNSRPIKDKVVTGAIKAAYMDYLGGGRFPVLALFITMPPEDVDVNVHPAKAEVRFRDGRNVSGLIITALRQALNTAGHRASTTVADYAMNRLSSSGAGSGGYYKQAYYNQQPRTEYLPLRENVVSLNPLPNPLPQGEGTYSAPLPAAPAEALERRLEGGAGGGFELDYPLGRAKTQLHGTYIISETKDSIIITDQHAAHERLVYEQYKKQIEQNRISRQPLLVPQIIRLDEKRAEIIVSMAQKMREFGFEIAKFGVDEIEISQVPSILSTHSSADLLRDIADDVIEHGTDLSLLEAFEHVLETAACHNSIRAGRRLSIQEMDELLRQMEATPHSGQCNHGRPTYVELKLTDIEKLFGRS